MSDGCKPLDTAEAPDADVCAIVSREHEAAIARGEAACCHYHTHVRLLLQGAKSTPLIGDERPLARLTVRELIFALGCTDAQGTRAAVVAQRKAAEEAAAAARQIVADTKGLQAVSLATRVDGPEGAMAFCEWLRGLTAQLAATQPTQRIVLMYAVVDTATGTVTEAPPVTPAGLN